MATSTSPALDIKLHFEGAQAAAIKDAAFGIGLTPTAVAKAMMTRFANDRAIPFELRAPELPTYDLASVPKARVENGVLIMPASWRDDDDSDDDEW